MESLGGSWCAVKARDPRVIRKAAKGMLAEGRAWAQESWERKAKREIR